MAKTKPGKDKARQKAALPSKASRSKAQPAASPAPEDTGPSVDIGITAADRKKISQELSVYLADAFTLYLKTHNFHWNVTGPMFNALHNMFEAQYTEQWAALDEVAERIRALGYNAPASYAEFTSLTTIREEPGLPKAPDWKEMVRQLVAGNEAVCRTARHAAEVCDEADDDPTEDLLIQRLQVHEKNAWMLRSLLQ